MRLLGGTHFLLLERIAGSLEHQVRGFEYFDQAILKWGPGARISPLFAVDGSKIPSFDDQGCADSIVFLGPITPEQITDKFSSAFLSLGLFNVVVFCKDTEETSRAVSFACQHHVAWEKWPLSGSRLLVPEFSPYVAPDAGPGMQESFSSNSPSLIAAEREYRVLALTTYAKSSQFNAAFAREFLTFDRLFRKVFTDGNELDTATKQGLLVNVNAVLSRHTSQTYAGTSPIFENECQIWTHSLLGIGVASLALINIRRFVEDAFSAANISGRIRALDHVKPAPFALWNAPSNSTADEFWDKDHLAAVEPNEVENSAEPVLPLMTCFSGRDGFRSTDVTLSVPLETVHSCNTNSWTPLTVTHELSHTLITSVLGVLLPHPDCHDQLERVVSLFSNDPENLRDQLSSLLCFAIWQIDGGDKAITPNRLGVAIQKHWREINELLTHCFDFLYFYSKDTDAYVRSIWTSWEVVPNVRDRLTEYVLRSLCATHTRNVRRRRSFDVSIAQLESSFKATRREFPDARCIALAFAELEADRSRYKELLIQRHLLVQFVKFFLYSPTVETSLTADRSLGSKRNTTDHSGYPQKFPSFDGGSIHNPLRFIKAFCTSKTTDLHRSAWILHQIAFGKIR